jgi:hypothetical protein
VQTTVSNGRREGASGYIKMEGSPFLCYEKYIHSLVPNAMSVAQLVVDIGSLASKVANNEFGALDQISDLPDDETGSCILVNSTSSQPKFAAFVFGGVIYLIHIYTTKWYDHEDEARLEIPSSDGS